MTVAAAAGAAPACAASRRCSATTAAPTSASSSQLKSDAWYCPAAALPSPTKPARRQPLLPPGFRLTLLLLPPPPPLPPGLRLTLLLPLPPSPLLPVQPGPGNTCSRAGATEGASMPCLCFHRRPWCTTSPASGCSPADQGRLTGRACAAWLPRLPSPPGSSPCAPCPGPVALRCWWAGAHRGSGVGATASAGGLYGRPVCPVPAPSTCVPAACPAGRPVCTTPPPAQQVFTAAGSWLPRRLRRRPGRCAQSRRSLVGRLVQEGRERVRRGVGGRARAGDDGSTSGSGQQARSTPLTCAVARARAREKPSAPPRARPGWPESGRRRRSAAGLRRPRVGPAATSRPPVQGAADDGDSECGLIDALFCI